MARDRRPAGRPLVVGIDARAATEVKAGRGRLVRELLLAFAHRAETNTYRCYCRTPWERLDSRFTWIAVPSPDPLWHVRAAQAVSRECDVFLSTNSYVATILVRVPTLTVVYDLMALEPETQPNRRSAMVERLTLRAAVRSSERLWCISRATADALTERYPSARDKLAIVPLAAPSSLSEAAFARDPRLPTTGFVLAVGTLEPRKNLPRLVEAYRTLPAELQDAHPLVVVGALGWRTGETVDALRSLGDRARLLGHVSDGELAELYRRCAVFCYPSLGEGFGLPVLEAMAAGAAVLTSNASSLPEVGGDAVEYADPLSVRSISAGLERLLRSPRRRAQLAARGRQRATQFSWDATAARVMELLQRVAADHRSTVARSES